MRGRCPALVLLASLAVAAPLAAQQHRTLEIAILSPTPDAHVLGQVEVVVSVSSLRPIARVELFVDGRYAGASTAPPFRWLVDVGQTNAPRRFEAVAEDVDGQRAQALVKTSPIDVDEEVAVELQQVYVTATRNGRLVEGIERHEFSLTDGGTSESLVTFESGDVPLSVLLAIDASRSMEGERLAMAVDSARSFFDGMESLDQARVLLFADRLLHSTPFTGFRQVLGAGLDGVRAEGGTALNDHLYMALKLLEAQQGRKVLIVLSDGFDTTSLLSMQDVAWAARRSQSMIYWLRLKPPGSHRNYTSAWRDSAEHRDEIETLERLVRRSGGAILRLAGTHEAQAALTGILHELRAQYVLGYYPSSRTRDGSWRQIRVRLTRRGVDLRYLDGYMDD